MITLIIMAAVALVATLVTVVVSSRVRAMRFARWQAYLRHAKELERLDAMLDELLVEGHWTQAQPSVEAELLSAVWMRQRGEA